ncbi:MAG TPA: hypothetical protein VM574_06295, partial [Terrimicrobiaceae bacterium]|nr:hypothetical protein [Terrimicrobiaceae bacterium]
MGQEPSLGLAARWAQRDGAGKPLADQYQAQGLEMLGVHAQFDDGSVEAGLADMLIRMESGRFKVFKHLTDWFDEEPPADIFTEGLTRTNVNQGPVWVTFTPLLGMSETVRRFLLEPSPDR